MRLTLPLLPLAMLAACNDGPPPMAENVSMPGVPIGEPAPENNADAVENAADAGDALENAADAGGNMTTALPGNAIAISQPYCAEFSAFVTQADCDRLKQQKANLAPGVAAFNPPQRMEIGQSIDVVLAIGREEDSAQIDAALGEPKVVRPRNRPRVTVPASIGRFMEATLSGGGFEITPLGESRKDLGASRFATWSWRVRAKEEGEQSMLLTVAADAVSSDGQPMRLQLASRSVAVQVEVTAAEREKRQVDAMETKLKGGTRVLSALEKLLIAVGAVIVAAGSIWLAIRSFGKKKGE